MIDPRSALESPPPPQVNERAQYRRTTRSLRALLLSASVFALTAPTLAAAQRLPDRFQDEVVISGLSNPVAVRFAADGRVFVAEKAGLLKVFDSLSDDTPEIVADLRVQTNDYWDRGLLGLALDPQFPAQPYVYVLYTRDQGIGGAPPKWGASRPEQSVGDPCPRDDGGCVAMGRLSRLRLEGNRAVEEQALVDDWFIQFPSHSIGALAFGADGYLYASGGDGANFEQVDYGQFESADETFPDDPENEGGALRSQDLRTRDDAVGLSGTVIRIDPATGAGAPDNPLSASPDPNARRVVAYGLRNPFRFTVRPGTSELYIGDVGAGRWEEINRIVDPRALRNFGWPCYEGSPRQEGFASMELALCEELFAEGASAVTEPLYAFEHGAAVAEGAVATEGADCVSRDSSVSGVEFYTGGRYPPLYDGAMFFADYARDCIFVMYAGGDGRPDPARRANFAVDAEDPVDLVLGPDGALYWVSVSIEANQGSVHRIRYHPVNGPPTAAFVANPTSGRAPLTVRFDASTSRDPDFEDTLRYAWDLDGDGTFDDATGVAPEFTYRRPGNYTAQLRVTDSNDAEASAEQLISVENSPPTVTITPTGGNTAWRVRETLTFTGTAVDAQEGELGASTLRWRLKLEHCPGECHSHLVQSFAEQSQVTFKAPDHEYPSHLVLELSATDASGLTGTATLKLEPETQLLSFETDPTGLSLGFDDDSKVAPFTVEVIGDSRHSISAPKQTLDGRSYVFTGWSDGGERSHEVTASEDLSLTATFASASDLQVAFENLPAQAEIDMPLEYALVLTNSGPSPVDEVLVSELSPASASVLGATQGSFDPDSGVWSGLSLGASESAQLRISTVISAQDTSPLVYVARVSAPGMVDSAPENNTARQEVSFAPPEPVAPREPEPGPGPIGSADAGMPDDAGAVADPGRVDEDGGAELPGEDGPVAAPEGGVVGEGEAPAGDDMNGEMPDMDSAQDESSLFGGCAVGSHEDGGSRGIPSMLLVLASLLLARRPREARRVVRARGRVNR